MRRRVFSFAPGAARPGGVRVDGKRRRFTSPETPPIPKGRSSINGPQREPPSAPSSRMNRGVVPCAVVVAGLANAARASAVRAAHLTQDDVPKLTGCCPASCLTKHLPYVGRRGHSGQKSGGRIAWFRKVAKTFTASPAFAVTISLPQHRMRDAQRPSDEEGELRNAANISHQRDDGCPAANRATFTLSRKPLGQFVIRRRASLWPLSEVP